MAGNTTQGLLLRDSHLASKIFGLGQGSLTTVPKPKFLFFVKFFQKTRVSSNALTGTMQTSTGNTITNTSTTSPSLEEMGFVAKMVDKPKVKFQTETLNQYNKKRIVQTKHEFAPLTMKFYDTIDNRIFQMFQAYYKFYYGDAWDTQVTSWQNDIVAPNFVYGTGLGSNTPWGYNPPVDGLIHTNSYFFDRIEIYQIFNGQYNMFTLVNPKIESFDPDEMNYDAGNGTCEIAITFHYEGMIMNVTNQKISAGDFTEMGLDLSDQLDVTMSVVPTPAPEYTSSSNHSTTLTTPTPAAVPAAPNSSTPVISTSSFGGQFNGSSNTGTATANAINTNNPNSRSTAALLGRA